MSSTSQIAKFLQSRMIKLVGDVIQNHDRVRGFIAFIEVTQDSKGKQVPSNHALSRLEKELSADFGEVNFVIVEQGDKDILANIKSTLMRKFPALLRNVFASVHERNISVWLQPKGPTTAEETDALKQATLQIVEFLNFQLSDFKNLTEAKLPSSTMCLSIVRKKAPITIEDIGLEIERRGFVYPNEDWLKRQLDKLRKQSLILRQSSGGYLMTLEGLNRLGSSKSRLSPDITRALELAIMKD
ncbi:hypothetical protein [Pseudovibrio sp. Alg231-02]|uniref:hypothetical protein n=1 Tax=Pseudovibrio sp. Alg231-02 TaxID=1922223 RepID=UPI000D557328|nr:hypothetical protein [Pseudovibrio sp. Alg231-02]